MTTMKTTGIEKISLIDKDRLSGEMYFSSLLEEALFHGLLTEGEAQRIQMECLTLLAYKTERFTAGESSSVPVERAASLMKSICVTIGIHLKSFPCPDDAVKILQEKSISEIYDAGRKRVGVKLRVSKQLHHMLQESMLKTGNYAYNETLEGGIASFFKLFDSDFEVHETHITADYPIGNPVENLLGIEFIEKYLESAYYENAFLKNFSSPAVNSLLYGYDEQYCELIINIYLPVLTCAIGCILVGSKAERLYLTAVQIEELYTMFVNKSKQEIKLIIANALVKLAKELSIKSVPLKKYMKQSLTQISDDIFNGVKIDKLELVFIRQKPLN